MSELSLNKKFHQIREEMLQEFNRLLKFWSTEAIDPKNGGFLGRIEHSGKKDRTAPKGIVLNARILWTFSAALRFTGLRKYRQLADRAYNYLMKHFWDNENGGYCWTVDYQGNPLNTRKQAYAQGFGIYALSEYNRATGNIQSLEYAIKIYQILEEKYWDKLYGGYIESLKKDWGKMEDMRLSEKDAYSPKSMNTHLHILESYTNLYRAWPTIELEKSLFSLLSIFENKIVDKNANHLNLFFTMDWKTESTLVSFGHDIEVAWLLHKAAKVLDDKQAIDRVQKISLKLVDQTIQEGFDGDSSVFYERDEKKYDTDKHWWPQAEALIGLMDAWEISHQEDYLEYIQKIWTFIKDNLLDIENGEWHWSVDRKGNPNTTGDKIGLWKCPYHNARALMEIVKRINLSKQFNSSK